MLKAKSSAICVCWFIATIISVESHTIENHVIGFPEVEEDTHHRNKQNRQPVYLPSTCAENELFYPGDQKDDWICDCRPAYLYHPATDACWPAFRQGPCLAGQMLVLPVNNVSPVCEKNTCVKDGLVLWKNQCESIGSTKPCTSYYPVTVLGVNASSLELGCVSLSIDPRFNENYITIPTFLPGCKRNSKKCINKV